MARGTYVLAVDWNGDGDFSDTGEDVTARTIACEWRRGNDYASQLVGKAIAGVLNAELNNESGVNEFERVVRKYAHGLRGLTVYPDGSRGGQPITSVAYEEANSKRGVIFEDNSDEQCLSGVCSI